MNKEELHKRFRPSLFTQNINQVENYDPNYDYKNVIFTYKHDPGRVQRYLDRGWEVVEVTESLVDDRSFTPNSKKEKLRPQPCITKTTDGHEQVLMKILKTTRNQNSINDKELRERSIVQSAKKRGESIEKRGNEVITRGSELSE